jgi:hypothetical protein
MEIRLAVTLPNSSGFPEKTAHYVKKALVENGQRLSTTTKLHHAIPDYGK